MRHRVLLAPWFTRFDIGLTKKIRFGGTKSIEFRADVLNVFNNINFSVTDDSRTPGPGAGSSRREPIAIWTTPTIPVGGSASSRSGLTGNRRLGISLIPISDSWN